MSKPLGSVAHKTFRDKLSPDILSVFDESFKKFTDVQVAAGTHLLNHFDVVVESPTGSGKTLAFLLPALQIMKAKKLGKSEIGVVVLSPSRELASQINAVAEPFAAKLGYTVMTVTGGTKVEKNLKNLKSEGANILVATPGRLFQLLQLEKNFMTKCLSKVEILIADEADRFNEIQFETQMREILTALPKQRRTGLFSATQAKEVEDLTIFGLRNAKRVQLTQSVDSVQPSTLNNFYTLCDAEEKTIVLLEFMRQRPDKKCLVFFPSCNSVRYFNMIFTRCLTKRPLFSVHGKCSNSQRATQIKQFSEKANGVMLSTDVMSRGIDISDIDWVIQFELPKHSSWFVHRAGRTARCGREGNALLILNTEQLAYVEFLSKHEKVKLDEVKVPTSSSRKAEELRQKMIKIECSDRVILEAGTRAFVSHVEAYVKHDCNIVCPFKDFDIVGLANSYGLLRLPKMRELSQRTDLDKFIRSGIETSEIKYADPKLEANRSTVMEQKHTKKIETLAAKKRKLKEKEARKEKIKKEREGGKKVAEAASKKRRMEEEDDTANDIKLLKKIKRGKLSKKELRDVL